jgi:hypothetical protein
MAREKAEQNMVMSDARQLAMACMMYASEHNGKYPDSLQQAATEQSIDQKVLQRPGTSGFDYLAAGKTESSLKPAETTPILVEKQANKQGKRVVAYADGHTAIEAFQPEAPSEH